MIRANLLPRPKETVALFGVAFDSDYVRQTIVGLAIVLAVAAVGFGIETLRVDRFTSAALDREAAIAVHASYRSSAKSIALDVARYQEFAREARLLHRSGADAAVTLARIGNEVPDRVWLDTIARNGDGYDLAGGARDVDVLGGAIVSLSHATPQTDASLVSTQSETADGVHFTARIGALASPEPSTDGMR